MELGSELGSGQDPNRTNKSAENSMFLAAWPAGDDVCWAELGRPIFRERP